MLKPSKLTFLAVPLILLATFALVYFTAINPDAIKQLWQNKLIRVDYLDKVIKYQIITLGIAIVLLLVTNLLSPANSRIFYQLGKPSAPAEPIRWLGIKPGDTWKNVGLNFSVIVTLVTGIFIYLNLFRGNRIEPENMRYLPFVLLFSLMNSFTEEAITRLSVVTALHGKVSPRVIPIFSGLLFGIAHYFGTPGGIIGVLMAGFLGWLLAKSVQETKGIFWAWVIHFLQDVVIFTGLFFSVL